MELLARYKNGNANIKLYDDGTRIIQSDDNVLNLDKPLNIDLKLSNKCSVGCEMCFSAGTKILMSDYTYKNIEDVQIGDKVFGFDTLIVGTTNNNRIIPTDVLNTFIHVEEELLEIKTKNKKIVCTYNHPIYVKQRRRGGRLFRKAEDLNVGDVIFSLPFSVEEIDYNSEEYKLGYLLGAFTGDGSVTHRIDKNGYDMYKCRFVTLDDDINEYLYSVAHDINPKFYKTRCNFANGKIKENATVNASREVYEFMLKLYDENLLKNTNHNYQAGFLAGFYDSEGHIDQHNHTIRIANTTLLYIEEVERCLRAFNIDFVQEVKEPKKGRRKPLYNVRILAGDKKDWVKFLFIVRPKCKYKGLEHNYSKIKSYFLDEIIEINQVNKMQKVYNFETGTHTYIANNILVHNCHENSVPNGDYAELDDLQFLETMQPGSECALGGGSLTEYPYFKEALLYVKNCGLYANCTFHYSEIMKYGEKLSLYQKFGMFYGIGISVSIPAHLINEEFAKKINQFDNVVLHVINGLLTQEHLDNIVKYINNPKILILGYKDIRRGKDYHKAQNDTIANNQKWLYDNLEQISKDKRIKCISFDNLAIEQLKPQRFVSKDKWDELYQGEDGTSTMYVDAVKKEFAVSSTCMNRHKMTDDISEMFKIVKKDMKEEEK